MSRSFVLLQSVRYLYGCYRVAEGEWKLVVRTSDFDNAGTFAQVFVTFYGAKSHSEKLRLTNEDPKPFQRGKASTFTVSLLCRFSKYSNLFL